MLSLENNEVKVQGEPFQGTLYWHPCSKTKEMAVLMCQKGGRVYSKSTSWLRGEGEDDELVARTNNLYAGVQKCTPTLLFRYGADEMHHHENRLLNFERKEIHAVPSTVLFQRTGSTLTFDCAFIQGSTFHECNHVEMKFLQPLLLWCREIGAQLLDSGADPVPVKWICDSLNDLTFEEVEDLLNPPLSSDSDSDWCPSPPRNKRKRSDGI
jgi:hypothetical protein